VNSLGGRAGAQTLYTLPAEQPICSQPRKMSQQSLSSRVFKSLVLYVAASVSDGYSVMPFRLVFLPEKRDTTANLSLAQSVYHQEDEATALSRMKHQPMIEVSRYHPICTCCLEVSD